VERGNATYYSKRLEGRRTSSGERLHRDSMTCAHRTHPFGTRLLVTNPRNGKQVIVRVNDRGPFARGRIIDLSYGAAEKLGIVSQGVAKVEVEVWHGSETPYLPEEEEKPLFDCDFDLLVPERDKDGTWFNQSVALPKDKKPKAPDKVRKKPSTHPKQ